MGLKWQCPTDQTCSTWALSYFMDCLCSPRDNISFFLGIASIVCWAVAEVPQVLVNWRSGHVEGVPPAFVLTWMIGDIFNLLGCWINPGTLPTQFFLAVLYSFTTVLLVVQQIRSTWTSWSESSPSAEPLLGHGMSNSRSPRRPSDLEGYLPSDLASELKPSTRSLPVLSKRGRPAIHLTASLPLQPFSREPGAYAASVTAHPNARSPGTYSGSWRRLTWSNSFSEGGSPASRGLIFSSLVVVGVTFSTLSPFDGRSDGGERRQLLQRDDGKDLAEKVGLILGWLMTCIYLTGRLPQVILNGSRDVAIDVSVPAVVLAFLGNGSYLGSILVRGVGWRQLKPVLPWVVDISCCMLMDIFVSTPLLNHLFVCIRQTRKVMLLAMNAPNGLYRQMTSQSLIYYLKEGPTILE